MITFEDLAKSVKITHCALEDCTRHYAVGERLVATLTVFSQYPRIRRRVRRDGRLERAERQPAPPIELATGFELHDKEFSYFDLSDCTARELAAFADLKGTIEKWEKGELPELPASTAKPYTPPEE